MFYICTPLLLFLAHWLKFEWSCIFLGITGFAIFRYFKYEYKIDDNKIGYKIFIGTYILALIITFLSGVTGHFYLNGDWAKHFAIFYDLVNSEWPIYFQSGESPTEFTQLVYYFGFYLTPSLILKMTNQNWLPYLLLVYISSGLTLSFFWIYRLVGKNSIWVGLSFIAIGGMDLLGWILVNKSLPAHAAHIEWWANIHTQYPSVLNLIFWVPQHGLAVFIGLPILLYFIKNQRWWGTSLVCGGLALWSPFICIGLIPILIYCLHKQKFKLVNLLPQFFYLLSLGILYSNFYSGTRTSLNLHLTPFPSLNSYFQLMLFYILEFGILAIYVWFFWDQYERKKNKMLFLIILISLLSIPLLRSYGWNDWAMRVSIPSLCLLWIWFIQCSFENLNVKKAKLSFCIILTVTFLSNVGEFQRSISWASFKSQKIWKYESMKASFYRDLGYRKQYFDDKPISLFFKQPQ